VKGREKVVVIVGVAISFVLIGVSAVYLLTRHEHSNVIIEETETGYDLSAILSQSRTSETSTTQQEGTGSPHLAHQSVAPSEDRPGEVQQQDESAVVVEQEIGTPSVVTAPGFATSDIYGNAVELAAFRGQVVILTVAKLKQGTLTDEEIEEGRRVFYRDHRQQGLEAIHVLYKSGFLPVTKAYVESRVREKHEEQGDEWTLIVDWAASIKNLYQVEESLLLIVNRTGVICHAKENDLRIDADVREVVLKLLEECASSIDIETGEESG